MENLTMLEDRLSGEDARTFHQTWSQKLAAMEARWQWILATQLLETPEFERVAALATAARCALNVLSRANPDRQMENAQYEIQ